MMIYGYVRVSSTTQNVDRQMEEMIRYEIPLKNIYVDKQSGKDFNRIKYQKLIKKLKKGDLLVIKSIDRLGRNYKMIMDEWYHITNIIEADILVIDMPLLDTRNEANNLVGKFISDIVLQILSFVAETERDNIKKRQAEGIKLAKARGVHMGRPKYQLPKNFNEVCNKYISNQISLEESLSLTNMKKSTFLKYYSNFKINN